MIDVQAFILTFKLAMITSVLLLMIGIPLAYLIYRSRSKTQVLLKTIVNMPLVLPPSVLGFYLLTLFSPNAAMGKWADQLFGISLIFSFQGLVVASLIFSLPFMVNSLVAGFQALPNNLIEAAVTLGKNNLTILTTILVPNSKSAILTGTVLTFAHTVGEFGVILMIGGSVPGVTRVASISIFEQVESMNYAAAHAMSAALVISSLMVLGIVYTAEYSGRRRI